MLVKTGDVFLLAFPRNDTVQSGMRPGVVIQHNKGNRNSPNVVVVPMTTTPKNGGDLTHVHIPHEGTGLDKDSYVLCESPYCIPKSSLTKYLTTLPDAYMKKIAVAYLYGTELIGILDKELLLNVWADCADRWEEGR